MPETSRQAFYRSRAERFERELETLAARSRLISNLRGLSFGVGVIALLVAILAEGGRTGGWIALVAFTAFMGLIILHARVIEREDLMSRFLEVNRAAVLRVTDRWHDLADQGSDLVSAGHAFADDLDVFGHGSLYQRISTARTRYGRTRLAELLGQSAGRELLPAVLERQEAVRVLTPLVEVRQELEALALAVAGPRAGPLGGATRETKREREPDPEPLLGWAEAPPLLSPLRWLGVAAWTLPLLTGAGALAAGLGSFSHWGWASTLGVQVLLALFVHPKTTEVFQAVSATEGAFLTYGGMLAVLERLDPKAERIRELKDIITTNGVPASESMREFRAGVGWFDLRHNGMVHPFAAVLLLWDVHSTLRLERWKASYGRHVRAWFRALGELEALSALAGFAYDEPDFSYPTLVDSEPTFEAEGLGHPLIAGSKRVTNDVELAGPGSALLVTGSNMSGKSTLLRAMGLAAVLAAAGAPLCATRAKLCLFTLGTSVRVRDSLESGISHFYAELKKLKGVVKAAQRAARDGERPVLFLLDEVLHGTNSTERQIGARWLLARLLELGAMGAVSTHDLELCRLPEGLMSRVRLVHFREQTDGNQMTFDYRLRSGPVTAGNALRLMRELGLDVPELEP